MDWSHQPGCASKHSKTGYLDAMTIVNFVLPPCPSVRNSHGNVSTCVTFRTPQRVRFPMPVQNHRCCNCIRSNVPKMSSNLEPSCPASTPEECEQLVRSLWTCFNSGAFSNATSLFGADAVYHDTLYPKPFEGRPKINKHLLAMESAFENGLVYVVDELAASSTSVGCRWHVELENGSHLPFSRGASMYKVGHEHGKLVLMEAWDFPEPSFKAASILLPVLSVAVKLLRRFPGLLPQQNSS